jgi:hypothetical protein
MTTDEIAATKGAMGGERFTRGQAYALAGYLAFMLREWRGGRWGQFVDEEDAMKVFDEAMVLMLATGGDEECTWPTTRDYVGLRNGLGPEETRELLEWLRDEAGPDLQTKWHRKGRSGAAATIFDEIAEITKG